MRGEKSRGGRKWSGRRRKLPFPPLHRLSEGGLTTQVPSRVAQRWRGGGLCFFPPPLRCWGERPTGTVRRWKWKGGGNLLICRVTRAPPCAPMRPCAHAECGRVRGKALSQRGRCETGLTGEGSHRLELPLSLFLVEDHFLRAGNNAQGDKNHGPGPLFWLGWERRECIPL